MMKMTTAIAETTMPTIKPMFEAWDQYYKTIFAEIELL